MNHPTQNNSISHQPSPPKFIKSPPFNVSLDCADSTSPTTVSKQSKTSLTCLNSKSSILISTNWQCWKIFKASEICKNSLCHTTPSKPSTLKFNSTRNSRFSIWVSMISRALMYWLLFLSWRKWLYCHFMGILLSTLWITWFLSSYWCLICCTSTIKTLITQSFKASSIHKNK